MNSRRTVIIAAALVLAALAFFGNVYYLNGAQQRAYKDAELTKVWVVKKSIPKGFDGESAIAQKYVELDDIPQEFRPGTAVPRNGIDVIKKRVAINDLAPGQVLVEGHFVEPSKLAVTNSQQVPTGEVAVTVSVDQVHGVAGLLTPGDRVNIITQWKPVGENADSNATYTQVLYQNVKILFIGTRPAAQEGDSATTTTAAGGDSGLITFGVPLEAATRIIHATGGGSSIYLTLVPRDNQPIDAPPVISNQTAVNPGPVQQYPAVGLFSGTGKTPYPDENK